MQGRIGTDPGESAPIQAKLGGFTPGGAQYPGDAYQAKRNFKIPRQIARRRKKGTSDYERSDYEREFCQIGAVLKGHRKFFFQIYTF